MVDSQWEYRSYNIDLKTILHEGGQTIESVFGNTGEVSERVILSCNRLADGLLAYQPPGAGAGIRNIGEIWVYGVIPFE